MPYVSPYELTKLDIAALKQANRLVISYNRPYDHGADVQAVKEFEKTETNPYPQDSYHAIAAPVSVQYNYRMPEAKYACHTSIWFGKYEPCHASSVIATLRAGDCISFKFYPDAHTNGYMEEANLHSDVLYLNVFRKEKRIAEFQLDHANCRDNTARMCRLISTGQLAIT